MTDSFARRTRGALDARNWGLRRRAWFKASGFDDIDLGKPVIGIAQTWSELNHCHIHFRELAEAVKRGAWQAGGIPAVMQELAPLLHLDCLTVTGRTLGDNIANARVQRRD